MTTRGLSSESEIERADPDQPATVPPELGDPSQQVASIVGAVATGIGLWAGPLPNPADLQAYEAVLPGAADRVFTTHEREQEGRHRYRMTELWLRYAVLAFGVAGAIWGMYLGREAVAVAALAGGVGIGAAYPVAKRLLDRKEDAK